MFWWDFIIEFHYIFTYFVSGISIEKQPGTNPETQGLTETILTIGKIQLGIVYLEMLDPPPTLGTNLVHYKLNSDDDDDYDDDAPFPYPTMLHSEQKCAHLCSEWSIVGYGTGTFWDLRNYAVL